MTITTYEAWVARTAERLARTSRSRRFGWSPESDVMDPHHPKQPGR